MRALLVLLLSCHSAALAPLFSRGRPLWRASAPHKGLRSPPPRIITAQGGLDPTPNGEELLRLFLDTHTGALDLAVNASQGSTLSSIVHDKFNEITQAELRALEERSQTPGDDRAAWAFVLEAVLTEMHARMSAAKAKLEGLLDAGELQELDKHIVGPHAWGHRAG